MKQYHKMYINEPIKTAITLLLDSQSKIFMITENNEPVGTLNRDQIIAALPKMGRYNCRKCYEKKLNLFRCGTYWKTSLN
jgi:hypothetical protein